MKPAILCLIASGLGALSVAGFAPFQNAIVPIVAFAGFLSLLRYGSFARYGALIGFGFGIGLFGIGTNWVYISMQRYSTLPDVLAVAATALFCAFFSLYPALFGYLAVRLRRSANPLVLLPGLWTAIEIVRGTLFGGFSWLSLGYSQVPNSVLAGYAPLLGVFGVTFMVATLATCLAGAVLHNASRITNLLLAAVVLGGGWLLQFVQWTSPYEAPVSVSLVQGNIPQDRKWTPAELGNTLRTYLELTRQTTSKLVVLPETALPIPHSNLPAPYQDALYDHARKNGADIIVGLPEQVTNSEGKTGYYNSAVTFGAKPGQVYRKSRLVPFGEFVPQFPFAQQVANALAIPLGNLSPGKFGQASLQAGGASLALNICFENIFGDAIARSAAEAQAIVNLSNLAWFGDSNAPAQFLQMAQMRALETGRDVMLATNSGPTAIVDHMGSIKAQAPGFETTVLTGTFSRRIGATPYSQVGDYGVLLLLSLLGLLLLLQAIVYMRNGYQAGASVVLTSGNNPIN